MRKGNFRFAVIAIALAVMLAGPLVEYAAAQTQSSQQVGAAGQTQVPQPTDNSVNWPGAGYGAGALLCNVLYIPAKLTLRDARRSRWRRDVPDHGRQSAGGQHGVAQLARRRLRGDAANARGSAADQFQRTD